MKLITPVLIYPQTFLEPLCVHSLLKIFLAEQVTQNSWPYRLFGTSEHAQY